MLGADRPQSPDVKKLMTHSHELIVPQNALWDVGLGDPDGLEEKNQRSAESLTSTFSSRHTNVPMVGKKPKILPGIVSFLENYELKKTCEFLRPAGGVWGGGVITQLREAIRPLNQNYSDFLSDGGPREGCQGNPPRAHWSCRT